MHFKFPGNCAYLPLFLHGLINCEALDDILHNEAGTGVLSAMVNGTRFGTEGGKGLFASESIETELNSIENNYVLTDYGIRIEDDKTVLAVGFKLAGKDLIEFKSDDTFSEWVLLNESTSSFKGDVEKRNSIRSNVNVFKASSSYTAEMRLRISQIAFKIRKSQEPSCFQHLIVIP